MEYDPLNPNYPFRDDTWDESMNTFEVEVFVDEEAVRVYLVHAESAEQALDLACERVRGLVGGEVRPVNYPDKVSEIDYDAVIGTAEGSDS